MAALPWRGGAQCLEECGRAKSGKDKAPRGMQALRDELICNSMAVHGSDNYSFFWTSITRLFLNMLNLAMNFMVLTMTWQFIACRFCYSFFWTSITRLFPNMLNLAK
jgi:hypothetical protein